jgi:hypothetical protein
MENFKNYSAEKAYKRIEQVRGFYTHLGIYCGMNIMLLVAYFVIDFYQTFWQTAFFVMVFVAGFGVLAHALITFIPQFLLPSKWERRRVKELIDKETKKLKNTTPLNKESMENFDEIQQLEKARKKIEKIKGFYKHLIAYVLVNAFLLIKTYSNLDPGEAFFTWHNFSVMGWWGLGLASHAYGTFGPSLMFGSKWEDRKIQEYMNRQNEKNSGPKWE